MLRVIYKKRESQLGLPQKEGAVEHHRRGGHDARGYCLGEAAAKNGVGDEKGCPFRASVGEDWLE